jgi:hypothetical protein
MGKRGTRSERMPRKSVTVCVGIRLLKATRKEVCKPMVPLIDVRLDTDQFASTHYARAHRNEGILTSTACLQ